MQIAQALAMSLRLN